MHISLPRTPVIYNKMCTSLPCPYRRSTRSDGRRGRKDGRRGRKDRHSNRTPATAHPTSTTCGQPPHRHHTKRRGAIYDARRPAGRNHRRTQHARGAPQHPRLSVRPTSCRLRAAAGVINGAPTTRRHQDNPTGRNHRRTQHARDCPCGRHLAACGRQRAS